MSKHTPGPWTRNGHFIESATRSIAKVCVDMDARSDDEQDADMAIISAAPDLLEALTACMFALGRIGANVIDGPNRMEWEAARTAIAKATGAKP